MSQVPSDFPIGYLSELLLHFNVPRYHALVFCLEDAQRALSMGRPNLLIGEIRLTHTMRCCAVVLCIHMVLCVVTVHSATHLDYYISLPSLLHLTVLVSHSLLIHPIIESEL